MKPQDESAGSLFLRIAARLFPEQSVVSVLHPAIADYRQELREAGRSRALRGWVRLRWSMALWRVLAATAMWTPYAPTRRAIAFAPVRRDRAWILMLFAAALYAIGWQLFHGFVLGAALAGMAFACSLRLWNNLHPARRLPAGEHPASGEINLSAIPVAGDAAGLIFAIGSICIVVTGLPGLWWYFALAATGSVVVAVSLFAAHARSREAQAARRILL
jgi:hypothetical protein